jgi:hypothetical protein
MENCISQINDIRILMNNCKVHGMEYPHFEVDYRGLTAKFSIESLTLLKGRLPSTITIYILEWAHDHKKELSENWSRLMKNKELKIIEEKAA